MSNNTPLLTIAIPTYNRAGDLGTALGHIAGQLGPLADRVEVLVSDNCSTDATAEVVAARVAGGSATKRRKAITSGSWGTTTLSSTEPSPGYWISSGGANTAPCM